MSDATLRLLEDRVVRLVERLRETSADRRRVEAELEETRLRLAELESREAGRREESADRIRGIAGALRQSIRELREPEAGDGDPGDRATRAGT